jgi:hypothetical protein
MDGDEVPGDVPTGWKLHRNNGQLLSGEAPEKGRLSRNQGICYRFPPFDCRAVGLPSP